MSVGPAGAEKAPEENPFAETGESHDATTDTSEKTTEPTLEPTPEAETPKRPGKNAPKAEVVAWADALGYSTEGTVKEIFARVDAEAAPEGEAGVTEQSAEHPLGDRFAGVPHEKLPIASQKGDLLLSVEVNKAGITVLNVSMFGYLGDVPVTIRAEDADSLQAALDDLREQAAAAAE